VYDHWSVIDRYLDKTKSIPTLSWSSKK